MSSNISRTCMPKDCEDCRQLFLRMGEGIALCEMLYDENGKPCDFKYLEINPAFERHSGLRREQVIGRTVRELIPDIEDYWIETYSRVVETGEPAHIESRVKGLDRFIEVRAYRHSKDRFVAIFEDTTERRRMHETLRRNEAWFRVIFDASVDGMVVVTKDGVVTMMNRAAESFLSLFDKVKVGLPFPFPLVVGKREEIRVHDERVLEMRVVPFEMEGESGYLACLRDITEVARARDDLKALALVDELTRVFNRRGLLALGAKHLAHARRTRRGLWLLFIDVDGMKWINDMLGHAAGDQALVEFSQALVGTLRQSDLVARVGGDEFVALTLDATGDGIDAIERRLRMRLDEINRQPARAYRLSCTIGSAYFDPDTPTTFDDLLATADRKMYERKRGRQSSLFVVRS